MKTTRILAVVAAYSIAALSLSVSIVVPNANTVAPGPSNQSFPFAGGSPMRYQQVFAASQFGGQSGIINSFAYRVDEQFQNPFGSTGVNCSIWFSHTVKAPQGLDPTFDNNSGGDKTLVFSGVMNVSSAGNPNVFDVVFDVNDVFNYNGTGNLLMEAVVFSSGTMGPLDAAGTSFGTGGTPWTSRLWAFGAGSTTGSNQGDDGMVTQFNMNAVPEPATMAALGLGLAALARRKRRA